MIAIDAMGGDFAPLVVVQASVKAARRGIAVQLYGDKATLIRLLDDIDVGWETLPISLIDCSQIVEMADEPSRAFIEKKDSSLVQAMQAVASGKAQAFVSAGNTGACLVSGMLLLGRIPGIMRPAIGEFIPTQSGEPVFCLDLGANVDCKPEILRQFAYMGDAYVRLQKKIARPRVALLSNGTESSKGSKSTLEAFSLLEQSELNFIGNKEPADILRGAADVVVCDGFTGNIMLKSLEAMAELVPQWIKYEYRRTWLGRLSLLLSSRVLKNVRKNIGQVKKGGALLLGVQKPLIIAHGSSNAAALENAIIFARDVVERKLVSRFGQVLAEISSKSHIGVENKSHGSKEERKTDDTLLG